MLEIVGRLDNNIVIPDTYSYVAYDENNKPVYYAAYPVFEDFRCWVERVLLERFLLWKEYKVILDENYFIGYAEDIKSEYKERDGIFNKIKL